jgi:hypothetical protein
MSACGYVGLRLGDEEAISLAYARAGWRTQQAVRINHDQRKTRRTRRDETVFV